SRVEGSPRPRRRDRARPPRCSSPATSGGRSDGSRVTDAAGIWSEQDTTPGAIDSAIRGLLQEQYARDGACAPARVLNLVVVVDREWRGEILNRLERVGRYHPSRLILCAVEPGRKTIDATVAIT